MLLVVTDLGADLEFDCAVGQIEERLDSEGEFDLWGSYTPGMGGPEREDDPPVPQAARYTGSLEGERLTFSIVLEESGLVLGPFELRRGGDPLLRKCL